MPLQLEHPLPRSLLALAAVGGGVGAMPPSSDALLLPIAGPTPWRSLWRLLVIPLVATGVFALITSSLQANPTGWAFLVVTAPLAAVLFVLAWWRARRARRAALV
ncbi:MAG: hypothetical protein ACKVOG_08925 [Rhodoglobus sp.]